MRTFTTLLAAAFALLSAQVASAQSSWTVGEVVPDWPSGPLNETWTPPITPDSAHPADTYEPAIAATDDTLYTQEDWVYDSGERQDATEGTGVTSKFRTACKPSFTKRADPILAPGQYPAGHEHTFFGPMDPYVIANVEDWDYSMGRAHPASTCQGGPLNATLYWEPSMLKEVNGLVLAVIPDNATFYYNLTAVNRGDYTRLRRNLRFIGGANPMNYNEQSYRDELTAAGLLHQHASDGDGNYLPAGFNGIQCLPASLGGNTAATVLTAHRVRTDTGSTLSLQAMYIKGPNGEDPWDGACTAGQIIVLVNAPDCWDGTNLSSPNGRDHFRFSARAGDNAPPSGTCPQNYVKIPHFETKIFFDHNGWTEDLQYWYFSSDRLDPAMTVTAGSENDEITQGDPASYNPCRRVGPYFCNGSTAHFDWWGAWDYTVMVEWELECNGLTIGGVTGTYADCGSGGIGVDRGLQYSGTPPEADLSPDPVMSYPGETASATTEGLRFFPINPGDENQGPLDLDVHH